MELNEKDRRFYTNSKRANGGNESLIDLLIANVERKEFCVKTNVPIAEKEDIIVNGVVVKTFFTSRFGFDFTIKVLLREGYKMVE